MLRWRMQISPLRAQTKIDYSCPHVKFKTGREATRLVNEIREKRFKEKDQMKERVSR
jgi:hypothetical protein